MALQKLIPLAAGAALVFGLAACDEAEQGRVLRYEKGNYLGQPDSEIPEETRNALRARVTLQGG